MAAEVGFEVTFSKISTTAGGKTMSQSLRGKASPKSRPGKSARDVGGSGRPPKWVESALAEDRRLATSPSRPKLPPRPPEASRALSALLEEEAPVRRRV